MRGRGIPALLSAVCVALVAACAGADVAASGSRGAFEELGGSWSSVPIRAGSFVAFGTAELRNATDQVIELVDAQPVYTEGLTVIRLDVNPMPPNIGVGAVDRHPPRARPIAGFEVPAKGGEPRRYAITAEVRLEPGATEGILIAVDVRYRSDGRERVQRFGTTNQVCALPPDVPIGTGCPRRYRGLEVATTPPLELLEQVEVD